ncbi:iron-chelator utilization protein [Myxococcus stipitatus DSM 14675]|uniref:Iron-chelator utilization protein n=1 Tax=Myxococcus stipitatus (strain DSM 14675 / JCM 12634 / Mx s8) TaxID=1278073 RepID=L7U9K4_MYXSD|nr:siderophore-interacting protein [Myxococcus stipitatus]AGC45616.1 iron-chelator utilization protein [Myxococcus stipitatus DSM 14675]
MTTSVSEKVYRRGPFPVKFRCLEVLRVTPITPHVVRITLGGEDIQGFHSEGADDHVKVLFPEAGKQRPVIPTMGPTGPVLQPGEKKPDSRDYTPRRFDPVAGELDLDFVLHGSGPASSWAAQAKPGDMLGVGGPRGSLFVSNDFDWYLLAGDETAIPAIARRLEELPEGARAIVFIEVADASEEQKFSTRANMTLKWLHRDGAEAGSTDLLNQSIRTLDFPPGDYFAWVSGESLAMRPIRDYLLNERGTNKSWVRVTGYWKRGHADHVHDSKN